MVIIPTVNLIFPCGGQVLSELLQVMILVYFFSMMGLCLATVLIVLAKLHLPQT